MAEFYNPLVWLASQDKNILLAVSGASINTEKPFAFGTLRMMQDGDTLQIRTCQNMYNGHQKNLILSINIPDIT
mgnify:CR=1 FL=1